MNTFHCFSRRAIKCLWMVDDLRGSVNWISWRGDMEYNVRERVRIILPISADGKYICSILHWRRREGINKKGGGWGGVADGKRVPWLKMKQIGDD